MDDRRRLFDYNRKKDKPDLEAEDRTPTLGFFFKLLWRKLGKLVTLNLMMVMLYLPIVAAVLIYLFGRQTATADSVLYAPLWGINTLGNVVPSAGSSAATTLLGIFGKQQEAAFPSTGAVVAIVLLLGFVVLTWGWQTVGGTYNLRSLVRGDSCFVWSDYFYAIKRNLKQGFFMGLIDVAVLSVLLFDWYYFSAMAGLTFFHSALYFATLILLVIYVFMRFYIYLMMITFDLSIKKLLKNALIFAAVGFKRNIMALIGIVAVAALNLFLIFPSLSIGFTLPIILPFLYLPALAGFMATYAAYPNIKVYMIDGDPTLTSPAPVEDEEEESELTHSPQEAE